MRPTNRYQQIVDRSNLLRSLVVIYDNHISGTKALANILHLGELISSQNL